MSVEQKNKKIVTEYFDRYWVNRDVSVVDELCSDDFVQSYPNHGPRHGKAGAKKMLSDFTQVFRYQSYLMHIVTIKEIAMKTNSDAKNRHSQT